MRIVSLDFKNHIIYVAVDESERIKFEADIKKTVFSSFIPVQYYHDYDSFTWNFDNEIFAVNQNYIVKDDIIVAKECFVPQVIEPMNGLKKRFNKFVRLLEYEPEETPARIYKRLIRINI